MCLAELVLSTLIVTFRVTEDSKVQKRDYIKYAVYVKQEILDILECKISFPFRTRERSLTLRLLIKLSPDNRVNFLWRCNNLGSVYQRVSFYSSQCLIVIDCDENNESQGQRSQKYVIYCLTYTKRELPPAIQNIFKNFP